MCFTAVDAIAFWLSDTLAGFNIQGDQIGVLLAVLKNRRLINIHRRNVPLVSLTTCGI